MATDYPWNLVRPRPERFGMWMPVLDVLADDALALAALEEATIGPDWIERVRQSGGEPVGTPTLRRQDNLRYMLPMRHPNGEPVLDESGAEVLDHVKFFIYVLGEAYRA